MNHDLTLNVIRADKRYFPLNHRTDNDNWGIVSSISVHEGIMVVTLTSIITVRYIFCATL